MGKLASGSGATQLQAIGTIAPEQMLTTEALRHGEQPPESLNPKDETSMIGRRHFCRADSVEGSECEQLTKAIKINNIPIKLCASVPLW